MGNGVGFRGSSAEHASEDYDDCGTEQGEADDFKALAHRFGVGDRRGWGLRSGFRAGGAGDDERRGGEQQEFLQRVPAGRGTGMKAGGGIVDGMDHVVVWCWSCLETKKPGVMPGSSL